MLAVSAFVEVSARIPCRWSIAVSAPLIGARAAPTRLDNGSGVSQSERATDAAVACVVNVRMG